MDQTTPPAYPKAAEDGDTAHSKIVHQITPEYHAATAEQRDCMLLPDWEMHYAIQTAVQNAIAKRHPRYVAV